MKSLKIVVVGAGSATFGRGAIVDVISCDLLREFDLTLSLLDINEDALRRMHGFALQVKEHFDSSVSIEAGTERSAIFPGADYVITSVALNRWDLWEKDFYIPLSYGFRQVFGENGGPGGAFHTLRSLNISMPIVYDMERYCPEALLINFTNPESRICLGVSTLTQIRCVGLCHGATVTAEKIAEILDWGSHDLDITIAGINHFHWALAIKEKATGRDLMSEFRERISAADWGLSPLIRRFYDLFGYLTYPAPSHTGEYVGFAHDEEGPVFLRWGIGGVSRNPHAQVTDHHFVNDGRPNQESYHLWSTEHARQITEIAENERSLTDDFTYPTNEEAIPLICDIEFDRKRKVLSVNVPNTNGAIANLPCNAIVEVSATASSSGITPISVGNLPEAIAGLCQLQISIQNLLVEAYRQKSKRLLLQALLLEPTVDSAKRAESMMEHMLHVQKEYMPELA